MQEIITTEILRGEEISIKAGKSYKITGYGRGKTCKVHVVAILESDNEDEFIIVFKYWHRFSWTYKALPCWDFATKKEIAKKYERKRQS